MLGANGMLGSEVARVAAESGLNLVEISRSSNISFDAESMSFDVVAEKLDLDENDWLVNCIGWIPQKSSGNPFDDSRLATLLNTSVPEQISNAKRNRGFHWIQIATDCVFSGGEGTYTESSLRNPVDLYGRSKVAGEELSKGAIQIRCSIVGRDSRTHSGIYSWFKSAIQEKSVQGYENHWWNGVSTTAFAKLAVAMCEQNFTEPIDQHWLPLDRTNKFNLLRLFALYLGVPQTIVERAETVPGMDRTLGTDNQNLSSELWSLAGYERAQSIDELCSEFIQMDRELGSRNV